MKTLLDHAKKARSRIQNKTGMAVINHEKLLQNTILGIEMFVHLLLQARPTQLGALVD